MIASVASSSCLRCHFLILFSRSPGPGGGGVAHAKKIQGYHQSIEMKLCMSQYSHESMPDANFESGSFSNFGDMKRGTSHKIRIFTLGNEI